MSIQNTPPQALTVKQWNAKKGTVAKMAGETGMAAALTKLAGAYARVPWDALDPGLAVAKAYDDGKATEERLRKLLPAAKRAIDKVDPLVDELKAVRDLAESLEKKWSKSKIVPASSAKYVHDMAGEAEKQVLALKTFGHEWESKIKEVAAHEKRVRDMAARVLRPYFPSLRALAAEVLAEPTTKKYIGSATAGFHQQIRGLNASLAKSPDPSLVRWATTNWRPLSVDEHRPTSDNQVVPKVNHVLSKLRELETLI